MYFLLTPCKPLVNIRCLNPDNFCNTLGDVLRHVTIREVWHEFTVFCFLGRMFQTLVGSIGLYCGVKVGIDRDIFRIALHVPLIDVNSLSVNFLEILRRLAKVSSTFHLFYLKGPVLQIFISFCYNNEIKQMPNNW